MSENNGKLFARIAAVMAAVRSLPKDGRNKQSNYDYVSSDSALEHIGRVMAENGLVVIPMVVGYATATEGKCTRTTIDFDMHICDVEGNAFAARWVGEGIDYGSPDKAANKAMTNATKYFLMKLFLVGAGGDDPDADAPPAPAQTDASTGSAPKRPAVRPPAHTNGASTGSANGHTPSPDALNRQFDALGVELYRDNWPQVSASNAVKISGGKATSANELTTAQIEKLIAGMKTLQAKRQAQAN